MPSVAENAKSVVVDAILRTRAALAPAEQEARDRYLASLLERAERHLGPQLRTVWGEVATDPDAPEGLRELAGQLIEPTAQFGIIAQIVGMIAALPALGAAVAAPLVDEAQAWAYRRQPIKRLPPEALAAVVVKGHMDRRAAELEAAEGGVDAGRFRLLVDATGNPPGVETLVEMLRRGIIGEAQFAAGIRQGNIRTEWTDELLALRESLPELGLVLEGVRRGLLGRDKADRVLVGMGLSDELRRVVLAPPSGTNVGGIVNVVPTLQDVIRWAGREVFEPAERSQLGIDAEFPPALGEFAGRIGLSEEYARNYWAAHWDLPSLPMAYDMFHRRVITRADLESFFRAAEIPPRWREPLLAIAETLYTRVDLRRLRRLGLITREEALDGYRDLGYPADKAEILVRLAEFEETEGDRELGKAETLALYEYGLISREDAAGFLRDLGYPEVSAGMLLDLMGVRKERRKLDGRTNVIKARYVARRLSEGEAAALLARIGVPSGAAAEYLVEWRDLRDANTRELTEAQLGAAAGADLITWDEYEARVIDMGYDPRDASILRALREGRRRQRGEA